ncbi:threonine/serine dehydratase [Tepidiforma sp.]|uniref:threonine ammonia-lyase n=1 Tax=Tepidiforma sp. TaxID=2682230 RepID=UPI002ADE7114|nr:threonine/serine dehydratase [Tepidiforma sp.]
MTDLSISFRDVLDAATRIAPVVHRTPVRRSRQLDVLAGCRVYLKCENEQRVGAFKIRGAYNRIAALTPEERARGVVAASSGNHAQGVALAARLLGIGATIFMPSDAPLTKVEATRGYGAEVVFYDRSRVLPADAVREHAETTGAVVVPAFDDPFVMAGQGTVALELLAETGPLDAVVVPLGGGGLLSGVATVVRALSPRTRIYGVEPVGADDWVQSLRVGRPVQIPPPTTIADGVRTREPGQLTFAVVSRLVDDVVTAPDDRIREAVRFLCLRVKTVVEPSGALGVAALMAGAVPGIEGKRVGVVLSGGNIDPELLAAILSGR